MHHKSHVQTTQLGYNGTNLPRSPTPGKEYNLRREESFFFFWQYNSWTVNSVETHVKAAIYCGLQVQYFAYLHIATLPSCFSSLLGTFWLFQAFLGYAVCFFCYAKHFSAMLSPFLLCQAFFFHADHLFPLPSIYLLCWALFTSSEHFSATLSTSRLF